jgi:sugar transferase (PEP-CTERM/EpsH1 system associated)
MLRLIISFPLSLSSRALLVIARVSDSVISLIRLLGSNMFGRRKTTLFLPSLPGLIVHMKLLFIANRVPYPPYRGDKLKIYNLARKLRSDHELHLIAIAENKADLLHKQELEKVFNSVTFFYLPKWRSFLNVFLGIFTKLPLQVAYFRSSKFQALVDKRLNAETFDGIHVQHLRMSQFFIDKHKSNIILDLPDAFSLYWQRRSASARTWAMRAFARMEYLRLLRYEKKVLNEFHLNLVCSAEDQEYLKAKTGAEISVLPNGVDTDLFRPDPGIEKEPHSILFTGNMDYAPNVDAVEYFCAEMLPEIVKRQGPVTFVIAGQRPVQRVLRLASEHVKITGFVKDIAAEYARAAVVVAPLRFGAGTQNKVLEAMAVGVPVVCTEVGFKGLEIESGNGAIFASGKEAFIAEVVRLLGDAEYNRQVAASGRNTVAAKFDWNAVAQKLVGYFSAMKA